MALSLFLCVFRLQFKDCCFNFDLLHVLVRNALPFLQPHVWWIGGEAALLTQRAKHESKLKPRDVTLSGVTCKIVTILSSLRWNFVRFSANHLLDSGIECQCLNPIDYKSEVVTSHVHLSLLWGSALEQKRDVLVNNLVLEVSHALEVWHTCAGGLTLVLEVSHSCWRSDTRAGSLTHVLEVWHACAGDLTCVLAVWHVCASGRTRVCWRSHTRAGGLTHVLSPNVKRTKTWQLLNVTQ